MATAASSVVETSCNLCRADDFRVLFPSGAAQVNQIVRCNRCGLMYANPRQEADAVGILAWPEDPDWDFARHHPQRYQKERLQVRDYLPTRALLGRLHPQRGRLIEVGCSLGFLLDSFRQDGWDVFGIEPDPNARRHAKGALHLETERGILESVQLPDASADVVVMLHVIEHVPDPVGTLREIRRILRPGGHLVLETPRYDSLMFKLLGKRERSVRCDGHIYFFTTESLQSLYTAAGFELEQLEYTGRTLTLDRLAFNLATMSGSERLERAAALVAGSPLLSRVRVTLNLRDIQRVCLLRR